MARAPLRYAPSPAALTSPDASASAAAWPAARPEPMAKLTPSSQMPGGEGQAGRVAGDQQAVGGELGHRVVAALGDQVGGVLLELAPLDERGDRRVGLEVGDELLGPHAWTRPARSRDTTTPTLTVSRLV